MRFEKNGYKFEIKVVSVFHDREKSRAESKKNKKAIDIICFFVRVIEITKDGSNIEYEMTGNIEYSMLQQRIQFNDLYYCTNELTLCAGDIINPEFNNTIKTFFEEDCDFETMIFNHIKPEYSKILIDAFRDTSGKKHLIRQAINIAGGKSEAKRLIDEIE